MCPAVLLRSTTSVFLFFADFFFFRFLTLATQRSMQLCTSSFLTNSSMKPWRSAAKTSKAGCFSDVWQGFGDVHLRSATSSATSIMCAEIFHLNRRLTLVTALSGPLRWVPLGNLQSSSCSRCCPQPWREPQSPPEFSRAYEIFTHHQFNLRISLAFSNKLAVRSCQCLEVAGRGRGRFDSMRGVGSFPVCVLPTTSP